MEAIIRNVKDMKADDRRSLENVVGRRLRDNQGILIRVIDLDAVPDERTRREAGERLSDLARRGRGNAAAASVSEDEVDAAVDEAIQHARRGKQ
jgi:hypothetical protein